MISGRRGDRTHTNENVGRAYVTRIREKKVLDEFKCSISKVSEIFTKYGENYFRKIEEKISLKFLSSENSVISLGGGGFINTSIRKMCKKNCLSFWLDWKNETIIKRIYKIC